MICVTPQKTCVLVSELCSPKRDPIWDFPSLLTSHLPPTLKKVQVYNACLESDVCLYSPQLQLLGPYWNALCRATWTHSPSCLICSMPNLPEMLPACHTLLTKGTGLLLLRPPPALRFPQELPLSKIQEWPSPFTSPTNSWHAVLGFTFYSQAGLRISPSLLNCNMGTTWSASWETFWDLLQHLARYLHHGHHWCVSDTYV